MSALASNFGYFYGTQKKIEMKNQMEITKLFFSKWMDKQTANRMEL